MRMMASMRNIAVGADLSCSPPIHRPKQRVQEDYLSLYPFVAESIPLFKNKYHRIFMPFSLSILIIPQPHRTSIRLKPLLQPTCPLVILSVERRISPISNPNGLPRLFSLWGSSHNDASDNVSNLSSDQLLTESTSLSRE
jgi:hypothetical protein